jgi:signal transduction histidine kinase
VPQAPNGKMKLTRNPMFTMPKAGFWRAVAHCLSGSIVIGLITVVCFRLHVSFPTPTFLCLIVIVLVSLQGNFLTSTVVSFVAVAFLDYYFVPPIFSFNIGDPIDIVAILAFLTTSATITRLVSRVRQLMEDKLRLSEAYLQEAQQLSHTGSFGWKVSTGETVWSDETFDIFEYDRSTKPTLELILLRVHPEDVPAVRQLIERAAHDGKDWGLEHRLLMPSGNIKHVSVVARARRSQSGSREFVGAIMDVTERKQAEELLRKAQANLAHTTRLTTVGELTASIAHEVNQPLAAVVTNANACLRWLSHDPPNYDEVRDAVRRIIRDGTRGAEVITRIRGLLKKEQTPKAIVDVNEVVRETIALARVNLQGAAVRTELGYQLPRLTADRVLLQQVLLNLIINAMDAMKPMTDRPHMLSIRTKLHGENAVLVAVEDSGVGLNPKQLEKLFDPFYTTKQDGLGIGLSICRSIIESHGGRLWAESSEGLGSTFQFTLPVESGKPA